MAQRGRPKKVQVAPEVVVNASEDSRVSGSYSPESVFDRDLFQASAVIAGAIASGLGGYGPTVSKTSVKIAKELLDTIRG